MMGKPRQRAPKLFYVGVNLDERIPPDNQYRRIAGAVGFDQVRGLVAACYGERGHESIDPVVLLKLMLILFIENVRSERELVRHLPLRLDWLWFCQMDIDSPIPHHSVLSKARRRWGLEVFERLFADVLGQCQKAGLIDGRTVHADSTLLKANADVSSRISRQLWNQLEEARAAAGPVQPGPPDAAALGVAAPDSTDARPAALPAPDKDAAAPPPAEAAEKTALPKPLARAAAWEQKPAAQAGAPPAGKKPAAPSDHHPRRTPPPAADTQAASLPPPPLGEFNARWVSTTDPDAATTHRRGKGVTLGYRDHTLVDNQCGIILATIATSADYDDAELLSPLLDQAEKYIEVRPREAVADSQYGCQKNQRRMARRHIDSYLKRRAGKGVDKEKSWMELLDPALDKGHALRLMKRRLHLSEGRFAIAHARMGHRRCRWRRRHNTQIQCYLVAMGQNIQKLTRHPRPGPRQAGLAMPACMAGRRNLDTHHRKAICRTLIHVTPLPPEIVRFMNVLMISRKSGVWATVPRAGRGRWSDKEGVGEMYGAKKMVGLEG